MLRKELRKSLCFPELKFSNCNPMGIAQPAERRKQVSTPGGAGCCGAGETGFVAVPGVSELGGLCLGFEEQAGCGFVMV